MSDATTAGTVIFEDSFHYLRLSDLQNHLQIITGGFSGFRILFLITFIGGKM